MQRTHWLRRRISSGNMDGVRARGTSPAKPISQPSRHGMRLRSISGLSRLLANRLMAAPRRGADLPAIRGPNAAANANRPQSESCPRVIPWKPKDARSVSADRVRPPPDRFAECDCPPSWCARSNPSAGANVQRLLDRWRTQGWPVWHIRHDSTDPKSHQRPASREMTSSPRLRLWPASRSYPSAPTTP